MSAPVKSDQYFASLPSNDLAAELMRRAEDYYEFLRTSGRLNIWRKSHQFYHNGFFTGGAILRTGVQDEYFSLPVNHFRNLLQHLLNMTTSQRPAFEPRAANTDYQSMAQVITAHGVLDYYMREKMLEQNLKQAIEDVLVFCEGEVEASWDPVAGDPYGVDAATQKVINQGDIVFRNYTPLDVVRDPLLTSAANRDWRMVRDFKNRWDLAAKFPALESKIMSISDDSTRKISVRLVSTKSNDADEIPVFRFYHAKTPALPQGRYVELISDDCWLVDTALPYRSVPLYRAAASEQRYSPFGYTVAFDLMPIQEALNGLYSTILTNQGNFGVQNVAVPSNANISVTQIANGMNVITFDPKAGKPEPLNLTATPPEIFNFISELVKVMETIAGINSVTRGNPEASLKSGAALALVQSMAIQFNSGLQQTYAQMVENLGTGIVNILQDFAKTPRMMAISGKSKRSYMMEFSGKDLSNINRVQVDMGNPLSRTTAGKVEIANTLLEQKLISETDEYLQVLTTGRLEPLIEGKQAELMLIRSENEKLSEGQAVMAVATDNHPIHITEHKCTIASPEARANPLVVQATLAHINEHINLLRTTDQGLLMILNMQPISPAMPIVPPAPGGGSHSEVIDSTLPVVQEAANVKLPNLPKNPLSGERFNAKTGGLV